MSALGVQLGDFGSGGLSVLCHEQFMFVLLLLLHKKIISIKADACRCVFVVFEE